LQYAFLQKGEYEVFYIVEDAAGNVAEFILTITIEFPYEYYYETTVDLEGIALFNELREIVSIHNKVSYGDARYILSVSDRDYKTDYTTVRGMYDNDVISTYWIGQGAGAWQREHVWPNSKLGAAKVSNTSKDQRSDLHGLRAITGINQTRSNRYFDQGVGSAHIIGSEAFYPGDDFKGDVARILFFMVLRYDFLTLTDDISLLENNPSTNYTMAGAYQGLLSLLVDWHLEDPVDKFEIDRNNFIYEGIAYDPNDQAITPQGNRNPFIDHPEWVEMLFG